MTEYNPLVMARLALADYVAAPVGYVEAQAVQCPLCGAGKRRRCVYLADKWAGSRIPGRQGTLLRHKGQQMPGKVHDQRKQAVRLQRKRDWLARNPVSPTSHAREAREAMRAWDVAEYERLRSWWAANGHIVAGLSPCRADGTMPRHRGTEVILSELL